MPGFRSVSWRRLIVAACVASLAGCAPENTESVGFLEYRPLPGFAWVDPERKNATVWTPGSTHPQFAHIRASDTINQWYPDRGYYWTIDSNAPPPDYAAGFMRASDHGDLNAYWTPGLTYDDLPHVATDAQEGRWVADPGYRFIASGTLPVAWSPGMQHSSRAHVLAGQYEGTWTAAPGYALGADNAAVWSPGSRHPNYPNIYAAFEADNWHADSGYQFAADGRLDTVATAPTDSSSGVGRFLVRLGAALFAHQFAEPRADDGAFSSQVVRPAARAARDEALRSAFSGE